MTIRVLDGDMRDVVPTLDRIDAVVTDPPYELNFMGRAWDRSGVAFQADTWWPVFTALKPGGHLVAFGGTRTSHRLTCAIEDAGFEIRDSISYLFDGGVPGPLLWCYGSGFPKSRNVSRDLDAVRCLCHMRGGASIQAAVASRPVLQQNMRGDREADCPGNPDVRDLRQGLDTGDTLSGDQEQDLLANVQRGLDIQADDGQVSGRSGDPMCGMREDISPAAVTSSADQDASLLLPVQRSIAGGGMGEIRSQEPIGLDSRKCGILHSEDDGAAQSGVEGRRDLQAIEGELRGRSVGAVSGGPSDDADDQRLRHGTSACYGAMDRQAAGQNGSGASPGSRSAKQRQKQSGTMADQQQPQAGGAWPLCGRCGKPRIPDGIGTALKPSYEPIILARKPLEGTLAQNTLKHGVGGLNIDATRIQAAEGKMPLKWDRPRGGIWSTDPDATGTLVENTAGRWPANVILSDDAEVFEAFAAYGERSSGKPTAGTAPTTGDVFGKYAKRSTVGGGDTGSAARFFFSSKADKSDRADSRHPTVKPVDLMRWLVRLITPPGGTILDPFAGSGTTGEAAMLEGMNAILVERDPASAKDIRHRIRRWSGEDCPLFAEVAD